MKRGSALFAALLLFILPAIVAPEAAAAADPSAFVSDLGSRALEVLARRDVPPAVRQQRFGDLFRQDFDVPGISRFVLGRYWRTATPEEQAEFIRLFEDYVVLSYSARLAEYSGETFRVLGARTDPDGPLVASEIQRPQATPLRVDWRLVPAGDSYKIVDVVVEGVSMAVTQRSEFASVIQRSGGQVAGLLDAIRAKTANPGR